jgi:predicted LPLAT superfamily acyltransferase
MKAKIYNISILMTRLLGVWVFDLISGVVVTGYFLFYPQRRRYSEYFYRVLFPGRYRLFYWRCVLKQYRQFSSLFRDRFMLLDYDRIKYRVEGDEPFQEALASGRGAIILMSHLGNWEISAHLLRRVIGGRKLLLFMGKRQKEQIEAIQKERLIQQHIRIIAVDRDGGSPFHLIEANQVLQEGGLVSLTGDMLWHNSQRALTVNFLGHTVRLPEAPHMLALLLERPLFALFPLKTGKNDYTIRIAAPIWVKATSRRDRQEVVARAAQQYADLLATAVRDDPFSWFHFEPFLDHTQRR